MKSNERKATIIGALFLFITTFFIFFASPVRQVMDSSYSMFLSQHLLRHHSFILDNERIPRMPPHQEAGWIANGDTYQLEILNGHLFYHYPPATPVLSAPFVFLLNLSGLSTVSPDGTYNIRGEERIEARVAALVMAGLCCVIFFTSRLLLPLKWSLLIGFASALGTSIWSTLSRGTWGDTWGTFLLGCILLMLTGAEIKRWRLQPFTLATLCAWLYFSRPTYSIPIAAISIYVLLYYRRVFLPYAALALLWLAGFVAYSRHYFHQNLPNYYVTNALTFRNFGQAFFGNLISPARGLLIYVPILLFVGYLLIRYRRDIALPRLVTLSLGVIAVHMVVVSGFEPWHGGFSYGPRFPGGLMPFFALLGIIGIDAQQRHLRAQSSEKSEAKRSLKTEYIAGGALLLMSVAINGAGAIFRQNLLWNADPVSVDVKPERAWDWSDPQFLRFLRRTP